MRRSDSREEMSYYGTNYTLPFAHAYRALGYLGKDRKEAIDKDTYHLSRLGFNAFRLHLWDVELADSCGNLLQNDHLDLLDYLIAQLEARGIDILLTAQTNFGNGYPEKNIDTGSFTYHFPKCGIHENPEAQKIQANYLRQLASHVNPYTGLSYAGDNAIIAMEINNEPCHSGTKEQVTGYINRMAAALKEGGFDKPIFYNVSHNPEVTEGYYDADIQGTTYQWYPTGLVAGHQRKGNFLPAIDEYAIPWKESMPYYGKMARIVYEFDPGDILYSYMYPAIARTFRKEGFQWITQFAYDPIDIARYNTEYQTHFLNLAYTPAKAISMMIAAEAAKEIKRGEDFGKYPADTLFNNFRVSYMEDLSELNSADRFYHSNTTATRPKNVESLAHIAGHGASPVISYEGTGAYFLDKTTYPGIWRLEVMPDVMLISDPFEKPSLSKEVAKIAYRHHPIDISLPQLGDNYAFSRIATAIGNHQEALAAISGKEGTATEGEFDVYPGVYLLSGNKTALHDFLSGNPGAMEALAEYAAPTEEQLGNIVIHNPHTYINADADLVVTAQIFGSKDPDSVVIYPSHVSFWREENPIIPMQKTSGFTYCAVVPSHLLGHGNDFRYNIVVTEDGHDTTWPQNADGNPLDWDFTDYQYYTSKKVTPDTPLTLLAPAEEDNNLEVAMIPEAWNFRWTPAMHSPARADAYHLETTPDTAGYLVAKRYIGDELASAPHLAGKREIVIGMNETSGMEDAQIALIGKNGATYSAPIFHGDKTANTATANGATIYRIPLSALTQRPTLIVPAPYPTFLPRETEIGPIPFEEESFDFIALIIPTKKGEDISMVLTGIWLE